MVPTFALVTASFAAETTDPAVWEWVERQLIPALRDDFTVERVRGSGVFAADIDFRSRDTHLSPAQALLVVRRVCSDPMDTVPAGMSVRWRAWTCR
jgi:hypothetical protein